MLYNNIFFETQAGGSSGKTPPIVVSFAGTDIHTITGPVPLVDFSKTYNMNGNNVVETITHNITLTGKIFRDPYDAAAESCNNPTPIPSGKGIKGITSAIKELENKLTNCPAGLFQIRCANSGDSTVLYEASGVKVNGYQIDKSSDNWVQSADYTIEFEYTTNADPKAPLVKDMSDNWSIEPLDEITYEDFTVPIHQRGEWSNPKLKPQSPRGNGQVIPADSLNNQPGGGSTANGSLRVVNVPQFRITRNLGCKGIPIQESGTSGICFTGVGTNITNVSKYNRTAFASAKEWVEGELAKTYKGSEWRASGVLYFIDSVGGRPLYLYNHARNTNIDIHNGTYDVTESWIAMPTGIFYTEEYNIDMSTDEAFSKTVRVAGTIRGLSMVNMEIMSGAVAASFPVSGAKPPSGNQVFDGKITLDGVIKPPYSGPNGLVSTNLLDTNAASDIRNLEGSKYQNALSGWLLNIKPYLYRRASLGINSLDRTQDYIPLSQQRLPAGSSPTAPPNNPIYCKEGLLNPIPKATTEGHDPRKGTISYSYEYSNSTMIISGVISENITITNEAPADIVNETQVIGRALGPIMTKTGRSSPRKSISIEIVVPKPTKPSEMWISNSDCPLYTGGYIYDFIDKIVEGVKPFGIADTSRNYIWGNTYVANSNSSLNPKVRSNPRPGIVFLSSDQDNWNPTNGRYSRTVSWTYQQCDNTIKYIDH